MRFTFSWVVAKGQAWAAARLALALAGCYLVAVLALAVCYMATRNEQLSKNVCWLVLGCGLGSLLRGAVDGR